MVLILFTSVFFVLRILPGDPVRALYGGRIPEEAYKNLLAQWGLDKPTHVQYFDYLQGVFKGDLGYSYVTRRAVIEEIGDRFPATLELTIVSIIIAFSVGILTGMYSAHKRNTPIDIVCRLFAITIYAVPIFWLGLMLQLLTFTFNLPVPLSGRISPLMEPPRITHLYIVDSFLTANFASLLDALAHLILPSITLGLVLSGVFTRMTRVNMLDVLRADYVTAARARGLGEWRVINRYAFRNAILPVLTMLGLQFSLLLAGAVLTESTFNWPGLGTYLVSSVANRDFPAIQGAMTFYALLVALVGLIVDIINARLDPRIRY